MKKLLILALVLGMASWAVATPILVDLTLTASGPATPGATITVSLSANQTIKNINNIDFTASGTTTINALGAWIGANTSTSLPGTLVGSTLIDDASAGYDAPEPTSGTTLYTFGVTCGAEGDVIGMADLGDMPNPNWNMFGDPTDEAIYTLGDLDGITVIPEPATIAILGLGALLLRRRK